MTTNRGARPRWEIPLLVAIVVMALVARGWNLGRGPVHPDEPLVVGVVEGMRTRGDWNTNWRLADLPENLRYDQFNFSGYHVAARLYAPVAERFTGAFSSRADRGLEPYRALSVLWGVLAVLMTGLLARAVTGPAGAAFAAAGAAVNPLLVQDAHYGRPEAFVTALFVATAWLVVVPGRSWRPRLAAAAFLAGWLAMTKVTLGLALLFPAWGWECARRRGELGGQGVRLAAVLGLAFLTGAFLAAPAAWTDPRAFLDGVAALRQQYGSGHPPHSLPGGGQVMALLAAYFGQTLGFVVLGLAATGAVVAAWRREVGVLVSVALPVLAMAGYFASQRVFFERNLSHVVPLVFVLGGGGIAAVGTLLAARLRRPAMRGLSLGVLGALALAPGARMSWTLVVTDLGGAAARRQAEFEVRLRAGHPELAGPFETDLLAGPMVDAVEARLPDGGGPLLVVVHDYHDAFTRDHLRLLAERCAVRELGVLPSLYGDLPVCTLLTYHNRTLRYLEVRRRAPAAGI